MAVNFPSSPTLFQVFETPDGLFYQWDGTTWVSLAGPAPESIFFEKEDPVYRTVSYTLTLADLGVPQIYTLSTNATLTLPALSTVPTGTVTKVSVLATSDNFRLTIDPNASETINGSASFLLLPGEAGDLVSSPTGWLFFGVPELSWRRLASTVASSSANVDFFLPTDFSAFRFEFEGVRLVTDNVSLVMRTSVDGGLNFDAGGSDYSIATLTANGGTPTSSLVSGGQIGVGGSADNSTAGHTINGVYHFYPGTASLLANAFGQSAYQIETVGYDARIVSGRRVATASTVNAVRFVATSGNISVGRFTVHARK